MTDVSLPHSDGPLAHERGDAAALELALELVQRQEPHARQRAAQRKLAPRELAREQYRRHARDLRAVRRFGGQVPLAQRPAAVGALARDRHEHPAAVAAEGIE